MDARTVKRAWRMALPALFVSLLLACVGTLAATPQQAHAKGTSTVWVITKIEHKLYEGGEGANVYTLKYTKDGLIKSKKEKGSDETGPWTQTVTYAYDAKHRVKSAKWKEAGTYASTFKYTYKLNKKGYVVKAKPSGSTYSYNGKGQLVKQNAVKGGAVTYKYDSKGRVKSAGGRSFKYDKKGTVSREGGGLL